MVAPPKSVKRLYTHDIRSIIVSMIIIYILIALVIIVALWFAAAYNGFVKLTQRVKEAWSDIDVQLKRRYDLIPNLVETVKGYAAHEKGTLEAVINARNRAMSASGP